MHASGNLDSTPVFSTTLGSMSEFDAVWAAIRSLAGQEFKTKTGIPFAYDADQAAVYPPTNRVLPRTDFQKAWALRPLKTTTQLQHLQGPSYIFAILTDPRIVA